MGDFARRDICRTSKAFGNKLGNVRDGDGQSVGKKEECSEGKRGLHDGAIVDGSEMLLEPQRDDVGTLDKEAERQTPRKSFQNVDVSSEGLSGCMKNIYTMQGWRRPLLLPDAIQ